MSEASETCRVTYWVYSPGGDAILSVPDYAEALAYAQEVEGRTMICQVVAITRTPVYVQRGAA